MNCPTFYVKASLPATVGAGRGSNAGNGKLTVKVGHRALFGVTRYNASVYIICIFSKIFLVSSLWSVIVTT